MMDLFSKENRRDPYPLYEKMRNVCPVLHIAAFDAWLIFDYDGVKRALSNHEEFSSRVGPEWLLFTDPPRHVKLRALISQAFTPRTIANLDGRIRQISRELLDQAIERGEMDLAADFSVPLPMQVIADMIGVPMSDQEQFTRWSDVILALSYEFFRDAQGATAVKNFAAVTAEMNDYLAGMIEERRSAPKEDLLSRLAAAEVDGDRLSQKEIVAFVQLLLVGGQETTTNLINNAILCFLEHPRQFDQLLSTPALLPSAIEEVLRYRSPFQWTLRTPSCDVEVHGQVIPAGKRVLLVIGSANRDPKQFRNADRFDIKRDPNPHVAFGHGIHACLGAALARLESRIALADILERLKGLRLASQEPWEPRRALHVHGPATLPVRFEPASCLMPVLS